jgi:membrane protein implicated in regulation of membrane protease activity
MEEILNWISENADWVWWSVGGILLVGEVAVPGVYLLWIGMGAALTGVLAWFVPDMGFLTQVMSFSVFAAVFVFVAHRFFYLDPDGDLEEKVNQGAIRHVGKTYVVVNAIENGRGHISVGDTRWLAEGPDVPIGAKVRVEAIDGTVMKVVPL